MAEEQGPQGEIVATLLEKEVQQSYLDYAMSVIVGRALPEVRDGLKPVHRRILFAMDELGNDFGKPYKKSARIVGEVIGKFHPHGDQAVYDALVRMAQTFSMRYPLIDGQGNFGSVDGDSPAAMRYTEVRLSKIARELLDDLPYETVPFGPNYDESLKEPLVMPSAFPNLLANGSQGIAVGMSTSIPPHNLGELIDALLLLLKNPEAILEEVLQVLPGPDFPTGAILMGKDEIAQAYLSGHGSLKVRSKVSREKDKAKGKLIVTELPYMVNKAKTLEDIAQLVKDKRIEGISDIRDESDRQGIRMVLELKADADPAVVENQLFKHTQLETTFPLHMVTLVGGRPKRLSLIEALKLFLAHREEIITKRTSYLRRRAEERAHILEALERALGQIDAIIAAIRAAKDPESARGALTSQFKFTPVQARAITDMKLERLTHLEGTKIKEELQQLMAQIKEYSSILNDKAIRRRLMVKEFLRIKEAFADERRTQILDKPAEIGKEALIQDEEMLVILTKQGYVKRTPSKAYRTQRHGGRGSMGLDIRDSDVPVEILSTSSLSTLLVFTSFGRVFKLKAYEIPETERTSRGRPIVNFIQKDPGETIAALLSVGPEERGGEAILATAKGLIKRAELEKVIPATRMPVRAITLLEGDKLVRAIRAEEGLEVLGITALGQALKFRMDELRAQGRASRGVRGLKLRPGDTLAHLERTSQEASLLFVCSAKGYGKKTDTADVPSHHRGSGGVRLFPVTAKTGIVTGVSQVLESDTVVLLTDKGRLIRFKLERIPKISRSARGVRLMDLDPDESIIAMTRIEEA